MAVYRKNEQGQVRRVANNLIQRWNDKIFQTTHSVVVKNGQNVDLYTLENLAAKYIAGWTEYTEYQLYFDTPNTTSKVYISYKGIELELKLANGLDIVPELIKGKLNTYTQVLDNTIWLEISPNIDNGNLLIIQDSLCWSGPCELLNNQQIIESLGWDE